MDINKMMHCLQNNHKAHFITMKFGTSFVCRTLALFFGVSPI